MKNSFIFLGCVMAFLISHAVALADDNPIGITVETIDSIAYPGEYAEYEISVTNNLNTEKRMKIFVFGTYLSWITLEKSIIDLDAGETQKFKLYLSPAYGTPERSYKYQIKACALDSQSVVDSELCSEKDATIFVKEKSKLKVASFKTVKETYEPNEEIKVLIVLNNTGTTDISGYYLELETTQNGETRTQRIEIPVIKHGEERTITEILNLDKYSSKGDYGITGTLFNENSEALSTDLCAFSINEKAVIEKTQTITPGIFSKSFEILIKNEGNKEERVSHKETLSAQAWLYSVKQSDVEVKTIEGNYQWVCALKSGESCSVSYRINYWIIYLLVIIITGIGIFLFYEIEKPHIHKKVMKKGEEHIVHIEVRNRSNKTLHRVEVSDFAPSIFKFVEDFHTVKPNVIKKRKNGVELLWKIGRLEAREERVLTYKVKLRLEVCGGVHMPKAKIKAVTKRGKSYSVESRKVLMS